MQFLIPFLILLLLFPFISIPIFMILLLFLAFILPMYIVLGSFALVIEAPFQLAKVFFNREVRKNHSLEHATANVLEESFGPMNISGYATKGGFYLMGDLPSYQVVLDAARLGLERMKRGESHLAVHPRCGTSILASNLLFSAVIVGGIVVTGYFSLLNLVAGVVVANILGRPFGRVVQRYITTTPDVSDMEILGILVDVPKVHFGGLVVFGPGDRVFVKTRRVRVRYGVQGCPPLQP